MCLQACGHPFFDDLRNPSTRMPDGSPLPMELFQLTEEELVLGPEMASRLIPPHISGAGGGGGGGAGGGGAHKARGDEGDASAAGEDVA